MNKFLKKFVEKLLNIQAQSLEGPIVLEEMNYALKNMKNNKTPGVDPSEFFRMFWSKLKFLVLRVVNYCYDKGKLSTTWQQSIIKCIPKGDKPRQYLNNWRPISLLCVLYKLMSTVIANRLKKVLDTLVSKTHNPWCP